MLMDGPALMEERTAREERPITVASGLDTNEPIMRKMAAMRKEIRNEMTAIRKDMRDTGQAAPEQHVCSHVALLMTCK
jgi:hypothetical protein